jgi:hypothetical protein
MMDALGSTMRLGVLSLLVVTALSGSESDIAIESGTNALVLLKDDNGIFSPVIGVDALVGMALISGGHTPERGKHRAVTARIMRNLLERQDRITGLIGDDSRYLYSHSFATAFLADCYGEANDARLPGAVAQACRILIEQQNAEGGWRHYPCDGDADLSVTASAMAGLRAAWNASVGEADSQKSAAAAVRYARACANDDGSFNYRIDSRRGRSGEGAADVPRAAAAVTLMRNAGIAEQDETLTRGMGYLRRYVGEHLASRGPHFWYGEYYAALAMHQSPDPEDWRKYREHAFPVILELQDHKDHLWHGPDGEARAQGEAYATAMALIILQMENDYLPIQQR